jgi:hypothetical protein
MKDIEYQKLAAKVFMWAVLSSACLNVFSILRDVTQGDGRLVVNILTIVLIPTTMIYFGVLASKNGERAEHLILGKILAEENKGVKKYET